MRIWSFIWSLLWAPLWILVLHPWWRRRAKNLEDGPWVIGGHRGRTFGDNSAAVYREAQTRGFRPLWIANLEARAALEKQGVETLPRGGWAARRAISRARVLIYSHGEDDLDPLLILLRGRTALRVYLNHSLNLLKGGGVTEPSLVRSSRMVRAVKLWLITDCDCFLYASERERELLSICYPGHEKKLRPGGGAHLDAWTEELDPPSKKRIYWFPTFRESASAKRELAHRIEEVTQSASLRKWLVEEGVEFVIGEHINRGSEGKSSLRAPFFWGDPSQFVRQIRQSEVLISDYSGVIFNFLFLQRPQLLFAFDLVDYTSRRHLLTEYDKLDFALHPRSSEELVNMLINGEVFSERLKEAAQRFRKEVLPEVCGGFAKASVETICRELGETT